MPYRAPISDFQFLFDHVVGLDQVAGTDRFAEATPDMVEAILTEAGRVSSEVLAPLQREGDLHPAVLENGKVRCTPGFDARKYGTAPANRSFRSSCPTSHSVASRNVSAAFQTSPAIPGKSPRTASALASISSNKR